MSWRDDPKIIWRDADGVSLRMAEVHHRGRWRLVTDEEAGVELPTELHQRGHMARRMLTTLGLGISDDGRIVAEPTPIAVGDTVVYRTMTGTRWEVLHVHGGHVFMAELGREVRVRRYHSAALDELRHIDEAPAEDPVEWVYTRDPQEIAAAIDAGRTVQCQYLGGGARHGEWINTAGTAEEYRTRVETFNGAYRYEGPAIEAPVDRCTPDNRICVNGPFTDRQVCEAAVNGFHLDGDEDSWVCSRPRGHDGAHVPCIETSNAAAGHNLHLRPEDR